MVKNISITQVHTDTLCCEPLLEKMPNGELLCLCQCGGTREPDPSNRVYAFHSSDNGSTWSAPENITPYDNRAAYSTELAINGNEITAYLTMHSGRFNNWECIMMKSFDNGYSWKNFGAPPHFSEYTFFRGTLKTSNNRILIPYQSYPITKEMHENLEKQPDPWIVYTNPDYCEVGILESCDNGKSFEKYVAQKIKTTNGWIWAEPTLAELSDKTIVMLTRRYSGALYRCDSKDGGKTWGEYYKTDIPNPANKPRLFNLDNGRIALINTPNSGQSIKGCKCGRYPLELWISDDDMNSWNNKTLLCDFPGDYCYSDGFYENGHIKFVIEHNRHTVLYFDVTL